MSDINIALQAVCLICLGSVVYAYLGYPVTLRLLAAVFGHRHRPPTPDDLPRVTLLIAAHNEAAIIAARLENALELDYPCDRLEIVVACDGCTDDTVEVVRRFASREVRVMEYRSRRGKTTVLNDSIPRVTGEVVILSDANTFTEPEAAWKLARWFRDERVGVVCGRLILTDHATGSNSDGLYWRYETFLKRCESQLGALLGANGGIYAIRKTSFQAVHANSTVDDFVIPLTARLQTNCDIIYDPEAIAHEETPPDIVDEFRRRARIGAGGFQSIGQLWPLLNPARGWIAFTFFSHKILRWGCPFFLVAGLVTSGLLVNQSFYRVLCGLQLAFYAVSVIIAFVPPSVRFLKPLRLTTMFTSMNAALMLGFWRWLRGGIVGTWNPTVRTNTEAYHLATHHLPGTPA